MSVRYVGFLAESSGYGQAARSHLLALASAGESVHARSVTLSPEPRDLEPDPARGREVRRLARRTGPYDTVIVHTPAHHLPKFREPNRRNIGVVAWETERVPRNWHAPLAAMDELWVPSTFCEQAFTRATRTKVHVIPHPIPSFEYQGPRDLPGVDPNVFLFTAIFEWSDRKNPFGLLAAFRDAFSGMKDVALFLKIGTRFGAVPSRVLRDLRKRCRDVNVIACLEDVSESTMRRIFARSDALVSLHRAEGFGLTLAEAMAASVPVVATGYSGNLDFMDETCAYLVPHRLVPVRETITKVVVFERDMHWAEPDHDAAVDALRAVLGSPARRTAIIERARARIHQVCDPLVVGRMMRDRIRCGA